MSRSRWSAVDARDLDEAVELARRGLLLLEVGQCFWFLISFIFVF